MVVRTIYASRLLEVSNEAGRPVEEIGQQHDPAPRGHQEAELFGEEIGRYQFVQDMIAKMVLGYETSKLLVMQAAGQTFVSRSHFDAQRYMEVGKPADVDIVTGDELATLDAVALAARVRTAGLKAWNGRSIRRRLRWRRASSSDRAS